MELGCAFHSKRLRGNTQCILNLLRAESFVRSGDLRRVGKIVCSCRGNDSMPFPRLNMEDVQQWLGELDNTTASNQLKQQIKTLLKISVSNQEDEAHMESVLKLLSVVQKIVKGDVAFLQQDKLPVVRRGTKVSAELSMPYTYTSYFVGTKGRHVKPLVEKYNVTKFCIKPSSNYKMSAMSFVIESSDSSEFTRELQSRAEQVVLKREQHFNKVQAYYSRRRFSSYEERWISMQPEQAHVSAKEAAQCLFARKKANLTRGAKHRSAPILHNSRCLNCLMSYTPESKQCSFHPGFVVTKKRKRKIWRAWNCCGRRSVAGHATHEEHKKGCKVGLHNWRPHRSSGRRKKDYGWAVMQDLVV